MRLLASDRLYAHIHEARALNQIRDLRAPKLMPSEICLCGANQSVDA